MKITWWKIIIALVIIVVFFFIFRGEFDQGYSKNKTKHFITSCRKIIEKEEWNGTVTFKTINRENHNIPEIHIKPFKGGLFIISVSCYDKNFFDVVKIGDNVLKPYGEVICSIKNSKDSLQFIPELFKTE